MLHKPKAAGAGAGLRDVCNIAVHPQRLRERLCVRCCVLFMIAAERSLAAACKHSSIGSAPSARSSYCERFATSAHVVNLICARSAASELYIPGRSKLRLVHVHVCVCVCVCVYGIRYVASIAARVTYCMRMRT